MQPRIQLNIPHLVISVVLPSRYVHRKNKSMMLLTHEWGKDGEAEMESSLSNT